MEPTAIIMMMLILGLIWGGLVYSLSLAIKKEKRKNNP